MHGYYNQVASYHIAGNGCQKCGDDFQFVSDESSLVFEEIPNVSTNLVTEDSNNSYNILKN